MQPVFYGGDINTDLTRNTPHAYALRNFISDFNLTVCMDAPVPYTYVSPNGLTFRIYNFLTTANLQQKVLECAIIDNLLFSDHVPLKVRLDINVDHMFERNYCRKLPWHKASSTELFNQYSSDLEYKLSMVQYNELSRVYNDILNMCIESSECIPTTYPKNNLNSGGGRMKLPGWSKKVEHLSRRLKMAEAISENRNRDLWSEVRRIKGRNKFLHSRIRVVGDEEIAKLFYDKYNHLYNTVSYDVDEMNVINTEINNQIKENAAYDISGVQRLKLVKSDGEEGKQSEDVFKALFGIRVHTSCDVYNMPCKN